MTDGKPATGRRELHKASTRRALEEAALRRFAAEGYDDTSVEQVAADAGVSTRTFFRYFATKDEVLDMGRGERQAELRLVVSSTPGSGMDAVRAAVTALAVGFADDRERVALRQRAATTSPVLRGRLFDTFASWEHTLAVALGGDSAARTRAAVGLAVFRTAVAHWLDEGGDLVDHVIEGFATLSQTDVPRGATEAGVTQEADRHEGQSVAVRSATAASRTDRT